MLAAAVSILQGVHLGLLLSGVLCGLGFVVWLARTGRWREPLSGIPLPSRGPDLAGAAAVLLAYAALQFAAASWLRLDEPVDADLQPGSVAWHRLSCVDSATKILISVLMVILLVRAERRQAEGVWRIGGLRSAAAAVLALLVFLPISELQLQAGAIVWAWFNEGVTPPMHVVLQAFRDTAWGTWGVAELLAGALVVAPVVEELFFRGVLLQALCHHLRRGWLAIVISAVAFGWLHFPQPQAILPLATMGIILGYLRLRCGALWPCILMHILFNARTMVAALLAPELLNAE